MIRLLFLTLICFNQITLACEKPIKFQVGSFFDSASVVAFWGDFSNELAIKLKCPTNLHPSATYKEHLMHTLSGNGDIFVVPFIYAKAFEKYQLKAAIKTTTHTNTYLVTNKTINPNNLKSLAGVTIQLPSIHSEAYLSLKIKLKQEGIFEKVNFKFGHSFQASAIDVVKGKVAASIVFSPIFDALPQTIKSKVNYATLNQGAQTGGVLMVKADASKALIHAIQTSYEKIKLLKWETTNTSISDNKLSDIASQQLMNIHKEVANQQNLKN